MIEKNRNNSKNRKFHISHSIFILAFCLMLLPFEQLSFMKGAAYADSNDMVDYDINQNERGKSVIIYDNVKQTLWRTNITPAEEEQEQIQKDELQSLIEQINSIELSLPQLTYEPEEINETVLSNEHPKPASQNEETKSIVKNDRSDIVKYELITEQTIQKLKKMAEKPEEVDNPYEIGNTLYLSSNIGEAAAFYKEALRRKQPDDISASEDRAWLLFQTANSLQTIDMLAASDMYRKLITEFPNSPWADYARVHSNIITWYTKDKPDELLDKYKR
ncbi:MAG: hypothetical protein JW787_14735 [Sedimentisphaerales bacterium]|nr:hypothetical protein [Sedimentisphaerales bacterium]